MPNLILLAGPNGSGKSTFAQTALRDLATFDLKIDADEIARDIDPRDPASVAFSAGRDALHLRGKSIKDGLSLVIETTLASKGLLRFARKAKAQGYRIHFIYLFISTPELCDFRVKHRVMKGGHAIPIDKIIRRYHRSLELFNEFFALSDEARVYNADLPQPGLIEEKIDGVQEIHDEFAWAELGIAINEASQN